MIRAAIAAENAGFDPAALGPEAWARLERLAAASPLYANLLLRDPGLCLWLEEERNLRTVYRYRALADEWAAFRGPGADDEAVPPLLRRWRRRMSLRVAYRSVNGLAEEREVVGELSLLAEFCLAECLRLSHRRWIARLGEPWDEREDRPARFSVLALGKLGGAELNFSSDIDLLYCYEGDGSCRREGAPGAAANVECFTKIAETLTRLLSEQTADGFLFRVDARLRPGGAWGPLVPSLSALEHYYATSGQTWERLALIKARPVAGDLALGGELLEELHSFRYPRRPPPSLLAEVAVMKRRTEQEIVGSAALERNVKLGPGGIREIEFIAQSLQLLHAGAYPFLQTNSTTAALEVLARYRLMEPAEARVLAEAYWFLRRVEHRLQMREEGQTHDLPADPAEFGELARSLGFASPEAFRTALEEQRSRVQASYTGLFADRDVDREFEAWWEFFTTERVPPEPAERLRRWFGESPGAAEALRVFVTGDHRRQITRELVTRFQHLAKGLDPILPQLARPLETLARLARCAERYGSRQQFLNACAANPQLLRVLALLCDRSGYAVELLCAHPEILEEVLRPEILRRRKSPPELGREMAEAVGPAGAEEGRRRLWLYLRAEQMRALIGELLGFLTIPEVEGALTSLADAALNFLSGPAGPLIVALGKYGSGELSFGSDLDLLVIAPPGGEEAAAKRAADIRSTLHEGGPLGPAFALDFRLRPHGESGPLAATLPVLTAYHRLPGGAGPRPAATAWTWEKQALTRARIVCGPPGLAAEFQAWKERLLYSAPLGAQEEAEIWSMRDRIERERDAVHPPERSLKSGPGGLIDLEFLVQVLQLRHGHADPRLRGTGTRAAFATLSQAGLLPAEVSARLLENYEFLRRIEFALRRDANRGVSVLPADPAERRPLARWLGYPDEPAFWREHVARMRETHGLVAAFRSAPRA